MVQISDEQARGIILLALAQRGIVAERPAVQIAQAIGRHESGYGVSIGHHNWGGIHCVHGPPCRPGCFQARDKDRAGVGYGACLRSYPSDVAGAADMVRELYRRPHVAQALAAGNVLATARAMGQRGYGIGPYHESHPEQYGRALFLHVQDIARALQEPVAAQWDRPAPASPIAPPRRAPSGNQPYAAPPTSVWPWLLGAAVAVGVGVAAFKPRHPHA